MLCCGPVTKPSSDIEILKRRLDTNLRFWEQHAMTNRVSKRLDDSLYTGAAIVQIVTFIGGFAGFFHFLGNGPMRLAWVVLAGSVGLITCCSMLRGALRRRAQQGINKHVADSDLGPLTWSEDGDWWEADVKIGERKFGIKIGGESSPDAALLAHARNIVGSFDEFRQKVLAFLALEAARSDRFADEIRGLEIQDVCLFWPERPDDGMIYFSGPDEFRLWRCEYVDRKPTQLGFDS